MKTFLVFLFLILYAHCKEFRRVCYFTNWSRHNQLITARFTVADIDTSLCTHLIYAFAKINVELTRLNPTDTADDNGSLIDKQGVYFDFTNLKKQNPNLKTLLSVGGATLSQQFPNVVSVPKIRKQFAKNCRIYLMDRNFDGLDIDWEYPGHIFKNEFTLLLKDLREEFDSYSSKTSTPHLLLTIASAAGKENIDDSYNIPEISRYVDFINVMAYDYFGPFSTVTGFVAPLWSRRSNRQFSQTLSQNWTIHHYIEGGVPEDKLVLGIDLLDQGAKTEYDEEQQCPFSYLRDQWVGYENPRSVKEKVKYAGELGLGGVMFWSLDQDDFAGKFCRNGTYPLLRAMKAASIDYTGMTTTSGPVSAATPIRTTDPKDIKTCQIFYVRDSASISSLSVYTLGLALLGYFIF